MRSSSCFKSGEIFVRIISTQFSFVRLKIHPTYSLYSKNAKGSFYHDKVLKIWVKIPLQNNRKNRAPISLLLSCSKLYNKSVRTKSCLGDLLDRNVSFNEKVEFQTKLKFTSQQYQSRARALTRKEVNIYDIGIEATAWSAHNSKQTTL